MELPGPWRARVADDALRRTFPDPGLDDSDWDEIDVPGHWRNHEAFSETDGPVLYRTTFTTNEIDENQRVFLHLAGIFYQGDVWLDGAYLGYTEGYFFTHVFEISEQAYARTDHVLAIEVACSPQSDLRAKRAITGAFHDAAYLDPTWNPGGIWRRVSWFETGPIPLRHFRVTCTAATPERATLTLRSVVRAEASRTVTFRTRVLGVQHDHEVPLAAGENRVEWTVDIADPPLWWPHSLGDQNMVDVAVDVLLEDGTVSDSRIRRTGLRSVRNRNWRFEINGQRLFLKGVNLAPTRHDLGAATADELRRDVELAKELGADFIRVHSHISRPELYDAANELGMLVWQDFPLHGGYDRGIRKEAGRQAREAVDVLAHHPSVFVWCAHNEPFGKPDDAPRPRGSIWKHQQPTWNKTVLDRTVSRAISRSDPSRPVIPHSGVLPHVPQLDGTDAHLWFGWRAGEVGDLAHFIRRIPKAGRFVSEFGAAAAPDSFDFRSAAWPPYGIEAEQASRRIGLYLLDRFPPEHYRDISTWRVATQTFQAYLLQLQIEALRKIKYRPTGGLSMYHLADAQPAASTALLDHERNPKPAFRAVQTAYQPVLPMADPLPYLLQPGERVALDVHVVSDLRTQILDASISAVLTSANGPERWTWGGDLEPDSVRKVGIIDWAAPLEPGPVELELTLTAGGVTATNRYVSEVQRPTGQAL